MIKPIFLLAIILSIQNTNAQLARRDGKSNMTSFKGEIQVGLNALPQYNLFKKNSGTEYLIGYNHYISAFWKVRSSFVYGYGKRYHALRDNTKDSRTLQFYAGVQRSIFQNKDMNYNIYAMLDATYIEIKSTETYHFRPSSNSTCVLHKYGPSLGLGTEVWIKKKFGIASEFMIAPLLHSRTCHNIYTTSHLKPSYAFNVPRHFSIILKYRFR